MPQRGFGCFVKWFYLALIVQAFLCIGQIECRQHHQQHRNNNNNNNSNNGNNNSNNNNKNKRGDTESSEENNLSQGDDNGFDFGDNDSSRGVGHGNGHGGGGSAGGGGGGGGGHRIRRKQNRQEESGLSLWISDQQLKMLTALYFPQAYAQRIYAIHNNHVTNEMRDTTVYNYLVIPSEVNYVNFTWKSGKRKYFYDFDRLQTLDESILKAPTLSINKHGRIPQEQKNFSIFLPCTGNSSGTAQFSVGLKIQTKKNKPLSGTPIRLNFKKECAHRAPDPECGLKCGKNGYCTEDRICRCNPGYSGQYCETAFCFPQCLNGGNCTEPSVCTCPEGYQGTQCEGGICKEKCMNGGKCIQKDKCQCTKGYYGLHCEYSKCVIPCKNGGRCIGNNLCRCPNGLRGDHCEIGRKQRSTCKCSHGGICLGNRGCKCQHGYEGRHCRRRIPSHRAH